MVLGPDGEAQEVRDFITGLALPTDVVFGPDGAMYVAGVEGVFRVAPAPTTPSATVPVAAAGTAFLSLVVVVPAGTTVEWNGVLLANTATTSATLAGAVTGQARDPSNGDGNPDTFHRALGQGSTVRHTFNTPGVYPYCCAIHHLLGLEGTVVVV